MKQGALWRPDHCLPHNTIPKEQCTRKQSQWYIVYRHFIQENAFQRGINAFQQGINKSRSNVDLDE